MHIYSDSENIFVNLTGAWCGSFCRFTARKCFFNVCCCRSFRHSFYINRTSTQTRLFVYFWNLPGL